MAPPKLTPGQPIIFPAAEWNRHVDASDAYHRTKALGDGQLRSSQPRDTNIVHAKNVSGADRRQGEILEFRGSPLSDFSDGLIWLNGGQPDLTGGFGVLLQAAPAGQFADCQVSGVCTALVNVTDEDHKYAKPVANNPVLQSKQSGSVRILYKPPGTGELECAVRLEQDAPKGGESVVFELTSDLALGGEAAAQICELAGGSYAATGDPIIVVDPYPGFGMWAGQTGYRGVAQKRVDDKYDILFMERAALIVKFTTYGNRNPAATTFTGTVVIAYQHGDRPPPDMTSGRITIQDVERLFPRALDGGAGLALWNDVVGIYQCLVVQQQCLTALAQIDDTGGMSAIGYVPIKNFIATSVSPFNLAPSPLPTQAINYHGHKGQNGDYLRLVWDEAAADWVIVEVDRHEANVVIDLRLNDNQTQLQVKTLRCALEYSVSPAWTDKIPLAKCDQ